MAGDIKRKSLRKMKVDLVKACKGISTELTLVVTKMIRESKDHLSGSSLFLLQVFYVKIYNEYNIRFWFDTCVCF